ncbi:YggS family pyridoxal phosphate-dependent enzyme [Marinilabiliaceae bacterium ANBcel2]|nr:YggS family pyridoxal phosphate-dependent enzyme [Marinilabiliaceae bacterium ANBcel2]
MSVSEQIITFKSALPKEVSLVAVSKTYSSNIVMEAYNTGHKDFGENKVQELISKAEVLPKDIRWHMIGHLQSNKVKYIAPFVTLIHAVDSQKLLKVINKEAAKNSRVIDCLLQVHIAKESSKYGLSKEGLKDLIRFFNDNINDFSNVRVCGLMGMATFTDDCDIVREEFRYLKAIFDEVKESDLNNYPEFTQLSMGMSNDYNIAIEEGSNIVRVGSAIFGNRNY